MPSRSNKRKVKRGGNPLNVFPEKSVPEQIREDLNVFPEKSVFEKMKDHLNYIGDHSTTQNITDAITNNDLTRAFANGFHNVSGGIHDMAKVVKDKVEDKPELPTPKEIVNPFAQPRPFVQPRPIAQPTPFARSNVGGGKKRYRKNKSHSRKHKTRKHKTRSRK